MNSFTDGMNSWKHVHQRIEEHENSKYHEKCVEAHIVSVSERDIDSILFSQQKNYYMNSRTTKLWIRVKN